MLVEDFISDKSTALSTVDQVAHHFLPNSYGLAPEPQPSPSTNMDVGPPPVTRLVSETLAASARLPSSSASRVEIIKSLLCSESDSEFGASSGDNNIKLGNGLLPNISETIPRGAINAPVASYPASAYPRQSSGAAAAVTTANTTGIGDYRSPHHHPFHIPLSIKIPTKVRLPPQKDGKRINQHTYKSHAPGNGLLKVVRASGLIATAMMPQQPQQPQPTPLVITERPYQTTAVTDHGILNIISSNDPGAKVPTPPSSYLSVNSTSTMASSSSAAPSFASTSPADDQAQAAMAMTSLSLSNSTMVEGARPRRSRGGKKRTSFTRNQLYAMERKFELQRYLTSVERKEFSNSIGLDDHHVKVWFQNRRSKLKRQASGASVNKSQTVRATLHIPIRPHHVTKGQHSQYPSSHVIKSEESLVESCANYQSYVPPSIPSTQIHPTPGTAYYPNAPVPSCTAAPLMAAQSGAGGGVIYASMNSISSSLPNTYATSISATGPGVMAPSATCVSAPSVAATQSSSSYPYAPPYSDSNSLTMMSSASHTHIPIPTMMTQPTIAHAASTASNASFHPSYGYVYDFCADQGTTFTSHGTRSSSPFANFPFSPGLNSIPEDIGVNAFNHVPIVPPVNMV